MLEIKNRTPFKVILAPNLDKYGRNYLVVIIKGFFEIDQEDSTLLISEEQSPPLQSDIYFGEAGKSSVRYEADMAPFKIAPDIILNGYAYAPAGRQVSMLDASLQIGRHKKIVRVTGDRIWEKSGLQWKPTSPKKFERMQMIYEHSYGGRAQIQESHLNFESCAQNPIGKGFIGLQGQGIENECALPNLENPAHLIQYWNDRPAPVGFGFIGRSWQPRISFAGTYDEQWQQERMPLLPMDFDDRYYNGAHPDLVLRAPFSGGEEIIATNLSESGLLKFELPKYRLKATVLIKGTTVVSEPVMDTVVIEPDQQKVMITWRANFPCGKQFLYVDNLTLDWSAM